MSLKNFTIRIDEKELNKFQTVAKHEGRSVNSQIFVLIRDCVEKFEKEHNKTHKE